MTKHHSFVLSVVVVALIGLTANAGFVGSHTGNSQTVYDDSLVAQPSSDGLINFAVYHNLSGDWRTNLGIGSSSIPFNFAGTGPTTGTEEFVYFYQVVNTNPDTTGEPATPDSGLSLLQVGVSSIGVFSSAGYITVGGINADFAGLSVGPATTDTMPGNGAPGFSFAPAPGFAPDATASSPLILSTATGGGTFYQFTFAPILTGGFSSIVYLTADSAPIYLKSKVHDGHFTGGDAPSPGPPGTAITPEPTSLIMLFGTVFCSGVVATIRKYKKNLAS
jgi:hypothetical protein